ncbi:MAG: hypothetical protein DMG27_13640 [Acidobacteria bacterium]|nr:MAG: hypothetical protein DMG27_13640 [Acidobacteriota bacterium]
MAKRKFAIVWWSLDDVLEKAEELGVRITREEARRILQSNEERIAEAMTRAGWIPLEDAIWEEQRASISA